MKKIEGKFHASQTYGGNRDLAEVFGETGQTQRERIRVSIVVPWDESRNYAYPVDTQ